MHEVYIMFFLTSLVAVQIQGKKESDGRQVKF